ncbi:MAG: Flp pilus assembly protein CpaB [Alphaproteobacteria bacterium]|nr:Flp pilus assembly protein CpaB [Alphaproteobacteria bacterium]
MNKNVLIVLGGAVAVALVVAMLVQVSLGGKKEQAMQEARIEVLVAAKNLGAGAEIKPDSVRWQAWPKSSVFPGAITRDGQMEAAKAISGRVARDVAAGEPVLRTAMLGTAKGNMVAASLDPGMRAVAIEVSASSMVGGFIGPGDFVDVILTYKETIKTTDKDPRAKELMERNLDKMATETVLQNIKVLAVDQMAKRGDDEKVKVGKTVTLAVSAHDAERLSLAQEMGTLTLALRSVGDKEVVVKSWPTISDARLTTIDDDVFTEYNKMQKDAGINPNIVRIYNGAAVTQIPAGGTAAVDQSEDSE